MRPAVGPRFSILTPVFDPPVRVLRAMVASVRAQTYEGWQLVLVDDCSLSAAVRREGRARAHDVPGERNDSPGKPGRVVRPHVGKLAADRRAMLAGRPGCSGRSRVR